jgi:hypothetical protein
MMRRSATRLVVFAALVAALAPAGPASASVASRLARFPTPPGCQPTALAHIGPGAFCTQALLVTATSGTSFTVTDGTTTRSGQVSGGSPTWSDPYGPQQSGSYNGYGWSLGPLTAGQVVTLWGSVDPADPNATLQVTRWIERTHGSPRLRGAFSARQPYRLYTALDISQGHVPENRMVWSLVVPFLELPQTHEIGGDGDVHVQTMNPCPSAGVTTETVPELQGYVDSPYLLPPVSDPTDDAAKQELRQVPPIGVPVVILGATRWDPGYGWWELHPIRAWRFPTAAELDWAAAQCRRSPAPQLDTGSLDFPVPYGAPSCGQAPVEGDQLAPLTNALGFKPCAPVCSVSATAISQPETLSPATLCGTEGVKPIVDRSQLNGTPAPIPTGVVPSAAATEERDAGPAEHENLPAYLGSPEFIDSVARAYCAQPLPRAGHQGDPFSSCRVRPPR